MPTFANPHESTPQPQTTPSTPDFADCTFEEDKCGYTSEGAETWRRTNVAEIQETEDPVPGGVDKGLRLSVKLHSVQITLPYIRPFVLEK